MPSPAQVFGKDRSLLITGASTGIGAALAVRLASYGGRLALLARRGELLEQVANKVRAAGGTPLVLAGDVADLGAVRELHRRLCGEQGPVHVAFLNAGVSERSSLQEFDAARVQQIFSVNVFGIANWLEVLLPDMLNRRSGIIAGISSLAAARGFPGSGVYAASKAAASHLLESLRSEARAAGIQISTVEPGFVRTPMTDGNQFFMPCLLEPEAAADIIVTQVAQGRRLIRFPLPVAAAARLVGALPTTLFDPVGRVLLSRQRRTGG